MQTTPRSYLDLKSYEGLSTHPLIYNNTYHTQHTPQVCYTHTHAIANTHRLLFDMYQHYGHKYTCMSCMLFKCSICLV